MSPQFNAHFTEEQIEDRHFGRLTDVEAKMFDIHAKLCQPCAIKLHNERMFIFAMQAALAKQPEPFKNRDGAVFAAACAA